jgi:enolase
VPLLNLTNGGKVTSNDLETQVFMVIPIGPKDLKLALQMRDEINWSCEIWSSTRMERLPPTLVTKADSPLRWLAHRSQWKCFPRPSKPWDTDAIICGIDAAASRWYDFEEGLYRMEGEKMIREDVIEIYARLCWDSPIGSIEDPLMEDDFEEHAILTRKLDSVQIARDDLSTTSTVHIRPGTAIGACKAVLWKFNQLEVLRQAFDAAEFAES